MTNGLQAGFGAGQDELIRRFGAAAPLVYIAPDRANAKNPMQGYACACGYPQELNSRNKVCGEPIVGDGTGFLRAVLECFGYIPDRVFVRSN